MPRRTVRLEQAADDAFAATPDHAIMWEGATVARVRPGRTVLRPIVEVIDSEYLDGAARERVRGRLQRFLDGHVRAGLAPLFAAAAAAEADPALRGLLHRLMEAIGLLVGADAGADVGADSGALDPAMRGRLKAIGVRAGRFALFMPALLKPRPAALRAWLIALAAGHKTPSLAPPGLVSMPPPPDWPPGFAEAVGWIEAGPVLIRLDIAERVGAELHWMTRRRPQPVPADLASRFSVAAASLPVVLRRLGLRIVPASTPDPAFYGPPSPALLTQAAPRTKRAAKPQPPRTKPEPAPAPVDATGPFAALAAWRR
jgi:ATP-dependent RNA helicase SUPV3L1/SUV3